MIVVRYSETDSSTVTVSTGYRRSKSSFLSRHAAVALNFKLGFLLPSLVRRTVGGPVRAADGVSDVGLLRLGGGGGVSE